MRLTKINNQKPRRNGTIKLQETIPCQLQVNICGTQSNTIEKQRSQKKQFTELYEEIKQLCEKKGFNCIEKNRTGKKPKDYNGTIDRVCDSCGEDRTCYHLKNGKLLCEDCYTKEEIIFSS